MRILVTGAAGFVGSLFVDAAARSGHDVVATDRRPMPVIPGCEHYVVKDMNTICVDDLGPRVDAVVHFATGKSHYLPDEARLGSSYQRVLDETSNGVRHMFSLAQQAGAARFVHISSMTVYPAAISSGTDASVAALDRHPERRGIYAHSKILADAVVQDLAGAGSTGMEVCVLRFALVCGPGMGHSDGEAANPDLVLRSTLISTGKVLPIGLAIGIGRPTQTAPLLDIRDLLRGIVALVSQDPEAGRLRVWDLQSGSAPRKRDLLSAYAAASGRRVLQVWLPRWLVLGGAWLAEGISRMRGKREYLPYRIARAYRFNPEQLPVADFWRAVGVAPQGSVESCLTVAVAEAAADVPPTPSAAT
jgi:nucleoside-diphosphate-sugar epimerase